MHIFTGVIPCTLTNKSSGHTPEYSLGMRLNISLMSQGRYLDWRRRALWIQTVVHVLWWRHTQMQRGFRIVLFSKVNKYCEMLTAVNMCVFFVWHICVYSLCIWERLHSLFVVFMFVLVYSFLAIQSSKNTQKYGYSRIQFSKNTHRIVFVNTNWMQ